MTVVILTAAFVQGLMGFLHCPGMCGPFVILLNAGEGSPLVRNLLYNVGRSFSYAGVGFGLGFAGEAANAFLLSSLAALVGGVLVILMGFAYLVPGLRLEAGLRMPSWLTRALGGVLGRGGAAAAPLMGIASGLLPCGMLLPAYGLALSTGSPGSAALVMIVFSLGTYPALFSVGLGSGQLLRWTGGRNRARWIVGGLLIAMGIGMIAVRVLSPAFLHEHMRHHS